MSKMRRGRPLPTTSARWRRVRLGMFGLGMALPVLIATACGGQDGAGNPPAETTARKEPVALPTCDPVTVPPLDPASFSDPTTIDNEWLPMTPGTQYVLEGRADRGGGILPHQVTFTVTDLRKVVNGVPTVVVWDVDVNEDTVEESELAFFAQDKDGNVWLFGEYPEEYEDGEFAGAPSTWLAGEADADAGVLVPADAQPDGKEFLQGNAPDVEFLDCGKDVKVGGRVCVPHDCYDGVRVVDERSPLEPDSGFQRKIYARGVGNIRVEAIDDPEAETLVLVERRMLDPAELAKARAEALKLEKRAYQVAKVYRATPPAR